MAMCLPANYRQRDIQPNLLQPPFSHPYPDRSCPFPNQIFLQEHGYDCYSVSGKIQQDMETESSDNEEEYPGRKVLEVIGVEAAEGNEQQQSRSQPETKR